ncbi:hypothetical protein [Catalinimonas niigatensis]|uniref:hypothetical protein n=1 Tax=Catalinimonas niigatensis TaxID=1397264 RepID=UPI002665D6C8|nr:hypothetical protein [Catalinimonas niigatensis]WPP51087.1 hypothetical protein PZB72_01595 [Catalinimonas niigatensis]
MKLSDLNLFSIREKTQLLREKGNYLATRTSENYYIKLYTIKGLYFEVWSSSHLPWQNIVRVKVFNDFQMLKPYLPAIYFSENKLSL